MSKQTMRTKIEHTKQNADVTVSNQEEQLIKEISMKLIREDQTAYEIGKLINGLVELKGGVKYGCKTIERISQHPKIQRSQKQLRRYWGYYLIFSRYGSKISKVAKNLSESFYYELARLLKLDESGDREGKTGEELVEQHILKYAAWKGSDPSITVDRFREEISRELERANPTIDDSNDGKNIDESNEDNSKSPAPPKTRKEKKKTEIGKLISFDDNGLELITDWFEAFATPDHLASPQLNPAKVSRQLNRVSGFIATMIEYLIEHNETGELNPSILRNYNVNAEKNEVAI